MKLPVPGFLQRSGTGSGQGMRGRLLRGARSALRFLLGLVLAVALGAAAVAGILAAMDRLPQGLLPWSESPRETYAGSLEEAELISSSLGQAWLEAGNLALDQPTEVDAPYWETVFFDPERPEAAGYRIHLLVGQELVVEVTSEAPGPAPFLEVFAPARSQGAGPQRLGWAEGATLTYRARQDGPYLVRLQPELLEGGRFTVTFRTSAALVFPVQGEDSSAIRSFYGDPRDGGRRRHRGVDIFAPRGTAVLAAADGRVLRAGTNRLGGKTVWLRSEGLGLTFYYAHLDRQEVRAGERVEAGEVIGRVGNTGNARSTSPHLHFAIHAGEARDPWPYLHRPGLPEQMEIAVDPALLGDWLRVRRESSRLRAGPGLDRQILAELPRATPLEVRAARGDWLRVRLPGGLEGFLATRLAGPMEAPVRDLLMRRPELLRHRPGPGAPALGEVVGGQRVGVLAETEEVLYVEAPSGQRGWISRGRAG